MLRANFAEKGDCVVEILGISLHLAGTPDDKRDPGGRDFPVIKRGKTMTTTNEIAEKIATEHGLTKVQSKAVVEAVFAAVTAAATSGAETSIPGFGKFKVKDTPEREARNPATGATIKVTAAKKLTFAPAKALKDALNG